MSHYQHEVPSSCNTTVYLSQIITSNDTGLTVPIDDPFIYEGFSFNLSQKLPFKKVINLARNVSKGHQPSNRKHLSKDILNVVHDHIMEGNLNFVKKSQIVWTFFLGDDAMFPELHC